MASTADLRHRRSADGAGRTAQDPVVAPPVEPPRGADRRARLAATERPLVLAGILLVTIHLVDRALAGPDPWALGVAGILALAAAAAALQPRVSRLTRFALAAPLGALFAVAGALSHVLGLVTAGPHWGDVTGVASALGGVALMVAAVAALAPPPTPRPPRSRARRTAHGAGWLVGALLVAQFVAIPLFSAVIATTAVRLPVADGALHVPHDTVHITSSAGRLAAWWVPSRNGAAVLVVHGAGSDRSRVARQAEIVARHGFGVLAIDLPGHGESGGRADLLGGNAQPAIQAALAWLARQPGVDPARIAGFGMSLGGETLLEAAARGRALAVVISDGAERPSDDRRMLSQGTFQRAADGASRVAIRAISGAREPKALARLSRAIGPRPVLLIAAGGRPDEIRVNRAYARAIGASARVWPIPEAGHTGGVRARPAEYARRVTRFLDATLTRPA